MNNNNIEELMKMYHSPARSRAEELLLRELRPFIKKMATSMWNDDMLLDDLIQEGSFAAYKHLERYDPTKSKLTTFLSLPIKNAICKYIIRERNLQTTHYAREVKQIRDVREYYDRLGIDCTVDDIIANTEMSYNKVMMLLDLINNEYLISLDASINTSSSDKDFTLGESLEANTPTPLQAIIQKEKEDVIQAALSRLPREDVDYVMYMYGDKKPLSYKAVAEHFGVTDYVAKGRVQRAIRALRSDPDLISYFRKSNPASKYTRGGIHLPVVADDEDFDDDEFLPNKTLNTQVPNGRKIRIETVE